MNLTRKQTIFLLSLTLFFLLLRLGCGKKDIIGLAKAKGGVLCDFETLKPWEISPENGFSVKISNQHVTQGRHALEVVFPKGGLPSINTRKLAHDWGNYEYFSVDIFNPQNEALNFTVRLDDASGLRKNIAYNLHSGLNKVRINRSQISAGIDAGNIHFVVLFLNEPSQKYTLFFDNMRLERSGLIPGLETASDTRTPYSSRAPLPTRKAVILPPLPAVTQGEIKVPLAKLKEVPDNLLLISGGIPFAPGQLTSEKNISFFTQEGDPIPIAVKVLARWPHDNSIRSVLVQLKYKIQNIYAYTTMKWGVPRTGEDLKIIEPVWEYPEGFIVMPKEWLCASQVIGEQIPIGQSIVPAYDNRLEGKFPEIRDKGWTGSLNDDGFYSIVHVFYQFYVRSGELKYFLAARKELLHYRENQIILEGENRGRSTASSSSMYIYLDAMADDYLLTGDPRSLQVAGYMAEYIKKNFLPQKAFYPKNSTKFWTERNQAFAFLGILTFYQLTLDKDYLTTADEFMENLYKSQLQWPSRGGFIHNLYAHDPEEGARPDEYGGSPFMAGTLLEPIIEYHRMTHSDTAADSIFRALDWLINEGLVASGDSFKYLTADKYRDSDGTPDLDFLIVHAFGYGYKISGYQRQDYLDVGMKVFERGIKDAYVERRKHFSQSHRSSAHFLAYIKGGLSRQPSKLNEIVSADTLADKNILFYEGFDQAWGKFKNSGDVSLEVDMENIYLNGSALHAKSNFVSSNLSFGIAPANWNVEHFPLLSFAYRIPNGTPVGMRIKTGFEDWICVGGTETYQCPNPMATNNHVLVDDNAWHEIEINIKDSARSVLPRIERLAEFQFYTAGNAKNTDEFWIDEFKIRK